MDVDTWLVEGVGGGCGRTHGSDGRCGRSRWNTGWHIWLAAQTTVITINVVKMRVMPGDIMMVSTDFVMKVLELINLFSFNFVVPMVLDSVYEKSGPV